MNEQQIIDDWFDVSANIQKLPTLGYPKVIYDFINATASKRGEDIFCVNGVWQRIVIQKEY